MEKLINGTAQTTLASSIDDSQTTITVVTSFGTPDFRIRVNDEVMLVTAIVSTTWTVVRGVEGTLPAAHDAGDTVDFTITAGTFSALRADNFGMGSYASRPTTIETGMRWLCTDRPFILHYNGSSWDHYGPVWRLKRPDTTGMTWVNQGDASFTNQTFSIVTPNATAQIKGLVQAAPTPPYTVEGVWQLQEEFSEFWGAGIFVRDSASDKCISWGGFYRSTGGLQGDIVKWNSPSSYNNSYYALINQLLPITTLPHRNIWWRIRDDGTNRYFEYSINGFRFLEKHNTLRTDFCTPNQVGFYVMQGHASISPEPTFLHFDVF